MQEIFSFLITDFFKSNQVLIISYVILNLFLYPLNSIYSPRLYSELINKISNLSKPLRNKLDFELSLSYLKEVCTNFKRLPIISLIVFITIVSVGIALLYRTKHHMYTVIFPKYKMWIRNLLFSNVLEKKNTDFEEQPVGKELMRIEDIIWTTKEIFSYLLVDATELLLISVLIIGYLFTLDKKIALASALQIAIILLLIYLGRNKIKEATLNRMESYYTITNNIDNSLSNLSNVVINNQTEKEVKKNDAHSEKYRQDSFRSNAILNNLSLLIKIVTIIFFAIILVLAYHKTKQKKITPTNFTTIIIILLHFQGYLYGQSWGLSSAISRSWEIMYSQDYLDELIAQNKPGKNLTDIIQQGKIQFQNVSYQYKKANQQILNNLNLTVQGSEKVGILGKSGSGKSTLVKLLIKLYPLSTKSKPNPDSKILIDGIPIEDINTKYLRHQINYINQNTMLFDEDVFYNIKYGNKRDIEYNFIAPAASSPTSPTSHTANNTLNPIIQKQEEEENEKIRAKLLKYDLLTIYDNLENSLHTKAGPKGTNLSMGMQKVTILMRGLMRDSKILIFDEPLAGLDQKTREKVIKMIVSETKNKTVLVITHDPEILPYLDRSVNLAELQDPKKPLSPS